MFQIDPKSIQYIFVYFYVTIEVSARSRINPLNMARVEKWRLKLDKFSQLLPLHAKSLITFSRKLGFMHCLLHWKLDFNFFLMVYGLNFDLFRIDTGVPMKLPYICGSVSTDTLWENCHNFFLKTQSHESFEALESRLLKLSNDIWLTP